MNGPLKITLGILGAAALFGAGVMTGRLWPNAPSEPLPVPDRSRGKPVASARTNSQETATEPRYRATTVFQINQNSAPDIFNDGSGGGTTGTNWLEVQVKALTAGNTLMLAVKNLKLETEWKLRPGEAAAKLERLTEVEQERGTEIVSLSAWSDSAEEAVTIANGVRDAYAQRRRELELERARRLTETITAQTKLQETAVEKSRLEMLELMKKHNIVDLTLPNPIAVPQSSEEPDAAKLPESGEIEETSETPSEGATTGPAVDRQKQSEYMTGKRRYESQVQWLNTIRENPERFMQEAASRNPIEILESAVAVEDP